MSSRSGRWIALVLALTIGAALPGLVASAGSYGFYEVGLEAMAIFTNETRQQVNGLELKFSGSVQLTHSVGIGANMLLVSNQDGQVLFEGPVVPMGAWELHWPWQGPWLVEAAWLHDGQVVEEIAVHALVVRVTITGLRIERQPITFSASSSITQDGSPLDQYQFSWEWDDGETAQGIEVVKVFNHASTHCVTLTVTRDKASISLKLCFQVSPFPRIFWEPPSLPPPPPSGGMTVVEPPDQEPPDQ